MRTQRPKWPEKEVQKLQKKIKRNRAALYLLAPGTYSMMGMLPVIEKYNLRSKTFATDGNTIFFDPAFAAKISDWETRGIMIHEGDHVSLEHHTRWHRWWKGAQANHPQHTKADLHVCWNYGADYSINGRIMQSENYGAEGVGDFILPKGALYDDFYSTCEWSVEKICNEMLRKGWTPPPEPPPGDDPDGDEDGGGDESNCGEILPSPDGENPAALTAEEQSVRQRVADAALTEKSVSLDGTGGMCDKIQRSRNRTSAGESIEQFLRFHFSTRRSFKRPNKRFLSRKIYLPSKTRTPHTLYSCIDSSASVGRTEFELFRGRLVDYAKKHRLSKIRVAYVDTIIHKNPETNEPWFDIDLINGQGAENMKLDPFGGGGTSFDPIFDYLEGSDEDLGGLIYFTDGFGSVTMRNLSYPVLWITSHKAPNFVTSGNNKSERTFGEVVKV